MPRNNLQVDERREGLIDKITVASQRESALGAWGKRKCEDTGPLLQGYQAAGKTFRVHLDGYDQRDLQGRLLRMIVCRARFCNCARAGDSGAAFTELPEISTASTAGALPIDQVN
jgi:hypothetical protein